MRTKKVVQFQTEISSPAPLSALLHDIPTTAKLLGTTTFAVRTLIRSGQLKFVHIGHRWLVSTSAMQDFIHASERGVA